jgi:tRNA dimethylallyltransferase|tara:strand:- start:2131 stop:3057 length:927 start_codon:yes stop_codon:yes gene_type:complete
MADFPIISIIGATASGKTSLSIELAQKFSGEIISADSAQVRRGMSIGTAAPTLEEMLTIPHHLVGVTDPNSEWTLVDWLKSVNSTIRAIRQRSNIPFLVGGTGQYIWSFLEGRETPKVPPNQAFRRKMEEKSRDPIVDLHESLRLKDPASAARIHRNNLPRIIRALEIITETGQAVPLLVNRPPDEHATIIGLEWSRESLFDRVDRRVERMFRAGLVEEAVRLAEIYGHDSEGFRAIGYREALSVDKGELTIEAAIELTKISTHKLIRSQSGWFRLDDSRINWLSCENMTPKQLFAKAVEIVDRTLCE